MTVASMHKSNLRTLGIQAARSDAAALEWAKRSFLGFCTLKTSSGRRVNHEPSPALHHRYLIDRLQEVERGDIKRLMVFMPPRSAKSTYVSKLFPPWYLGRNPHRNIIAASHTDDLASFFGRFARNVVGSPLYREIFGRGLNPDIKSISDWQMERLKGEETHAGGEYYASGVGGAVTGHGAHLGIIDDPVKSRENADSATIRNKQWAWYMDDFRTRLEPRGAIILIQTRWHEDDLAGRILPEDYAGESRTVEARDGEKWEVVNIPAEARPGDVLGRAPGEWLWTDRWAPWEWEQRKRSMTARSWNSMMQQIPSPEEGLFFRRDWIRWYNALPDAGTLRYYGASDYAVSEGENDWTVHIVVAVDAEDNIYLVDLWRKQATSMEWVEAFCDLCQAWNPLGWAEEKGQIQRGVGPFLVKRMRERKVYTARQQFASSVDKPTRAQSIRGRMEMGMLFFPRNAPWAPGLVSELLSFWAGDTDDQVDALSLIGKALPKLAGGRKPEQPVDTWREPTLNELFQMNENYDPLRSRARI